MKDRRHIPRLAEVERGHGRRVSFCVPVVAVVGAVVVVAVRVFGGGASVVELVEVLLDVGVAVAVVAPHWKKEEGGERLAGVNERGNDWRVGAATV